MLVVFVELETDGRRETQVALAAMNKSQTVFDALAIVVRRRWVRQADVGAGLRYRDRLVALGTHGTLHVSQIRGRRGDFFRVVFQRPAVLADLVLEPPTVGDAQRVAVGETTRIANSLVAALRMVVP